MFFTRLPWWRIRQVDSACFRHAAHYWPFAGWVTGTGMALAFWLSSLVLPVSVSVIVAIAVRLLLTGALHEDGLADCCDGLGGGRERARVLDIMKDSHIGSYGVIGLIVCFMGMHQLVVHLAGTAGDNLAVALVIALTDVWCKCCASLLVGQLPYARKETEAKAGVVYNPLDAGAHALRLCLSVLPFLALCVWKGVVPHPLAFAAPLLTEVLWACYLKRRIQGYTGDCCGAAFALCEVSMYLCVAATGFVTI